MTMTLDNDGLLRISDRLLFLKYALPCANTLVTRGKVSQEYIDNLVELVSEGGIPEDGTEKIFKVATAMCDSIGRRMCKDTVDSEVIRQYFLLEHAPVVEDRYKLMHDFNPVDCKTYSGKVLDVTDGHAVVETKLGKKDYRTSFAKDVKKGDVVAVHFDYIVERVPEQYKSKFK